MHCSNSRCVLHNSLLSIIFFPLQFGAQLWSCLISWLAHGVILKEPVICRSREAKSLGLSAVTDELAMTSESNPSHHRWEVSDPSEELQAKEMDMCR